MTRRKNAYSKSCSRTCLAVVEVEGEVREISLGPQPGRLSVPQWLKGDFKTRRANKEGKDQHPKEGQDSDTLFSCKAIGKRLNSLWLGKV